MTTLNLNALRVFDAVARHGSLRDAALELCVTEGALSQQIKQLEAALDVRLFDRSHRGLRLTDAGLRLHNPVGVAMGQIQSALEEVNTQSGRISVALPPSLAAKWLMPRLPRFAEAHPGIELQILTTATPETSGADFALCLGAPPPRTGVTVDRLAPLSPVAVTGPSLIARAPAIARPSFFAGYTLIEDASHPWQAWFAAHAPDMTFDTVKIRESALALDAAEAGDGIALVPDLLARAALQAGRLVRLMDLPKDKTKGLALIRPKQAPRGAAREIVEDWLRAGA
ncbi:LysR family transcriptional regulator [Rhodobacteraceae bacterium W635]|uniref:LysR substrate-binding domain-containing protein n=1 Tax=Nioella halotolerans TaxID=2303578 RepID=UPI000E3B917E|nr:LysR family transcriptional regulator [Rhodobacteraceae bacterium W635]